MTAETFRNELAYFRNRYVKDGKFTHRFEKLKLPHDEKLVKRVLLCKDGKSQDIAAVVLIIIYRFRNNLFHGQKWQYELQGQLDNFKHSKKALMQAIKLHDEANPGVLT